MQLSLILNRRLKTDVKLPRLVFFRQVKSQNNLKIDNSDGHKASNFAINTSFRLKDWDISSDPILVEIFQFFK